jgi:hypothetical protein
MSEWGHELPWKEALRLVRYAFAGHSRSAGIRQSCRLCSLIPGLGVKLSAIILAGPTVLSAVRASPPHDGVKRRWWITALALIRQNFNAAETGTPVFG